MGEYKQIDKQNSIEQNKRQTKGQIDRNIRRIDGWMDGLKKMKAELIVKEHKQIYRQIDKLTYSTKTC